ncbi:hypothetical protein [Marinitoga litoralis]|uniref:hypothetical protein n=1 Tax=Marinitoga litoralis TaxID=570855 RepID=UPI0019606125|nr:hypothetical protein [Marinitoga litoralis]MBM7558759.1 hypothetical protein [Marinitoga litoralis]
MEGWIPTRRLLKITEFADKFCGKTEPIHRYIYLYFDKVLRVSMTDGCAIADMFFSKEFFPFKQTYRISIQHLKGLLKGLKEEKHPFIRMLALDEGLKIDLENMALNIESEDKIKPEFKMDKILFNNPTVKLHQKDFINSLDFSSILAMEGDIINIVSDNKYIWSYYHDFNMSTYSLIGESNTRFSRGIPYVTIRHIIKSLSLLSDDEIMIFLEEKSLFLKGKGYNIKVCNVINPVVETINIQIEHLEEKKANVKDIKKIMNKAYTALPVNAKVYIVFGKDSYILAKDGKTTLTWKIDLEFKNQYLVEVNHRKLRSILSRMDDEIYIKMNEKKIVFSNKNKYLEIYVKEFKNHQ